MSDPQLSSKYENLPLALTTLTRSVHVQDKNQSSYHHYHHHILVASTVLQINTGVQSSIILVTYNLGIISIAREDMTTQEKYIYRYRV